MLIPLKINEIVGNASRKRDIATNAREISKTVVAAKCFYPGINLRRTDVFSEKKRKVAVLFWCVDKNKNLTPHINKKCCVCVNLWTKTAHLDAHRASSVSKQGI
jgi:hypothetical protein